MGLAFSTPFLPAGRLLAGRFFKAATSFTIIRRLFVECMMMVMMLIYYELSNYCRYITAVVSRLLSSSMSISSI